ncbi:hypothetical protein CRG98_026646 [Punica granatum]|uniref:Uncharacterized protein n=1 Tax=Punica granatum TaxID=22663 RepID=A0A2I0JAN6_PUNGR|nr:hypothetical protein CRG98_026646 [Punica granatum]
MLTVGGYHLQTYPVQSQALPGYLQARLPEAPPHNPEPLHTILRDIEADLIPRITHWFIPNFFAYFPAIASTAAFIEKMLCTCFNTVRFTCPTRPSQRCRSSWGSTPANIRLIPTTMETEFALFPALLRETVVADVEARLVPLFVCATVGTTSMTAVDPLKPVADVAGEIPMWLHVEAGSACICPEFRHYLDATWCCCLWVQKSCLLVKALRVKPEYLRNGPSERELVVEYIDWQVGTGRQFKSLQLWSVLRSYGIANLREHIRSDISMARMFEGFVMSDPRFEVITPRRFALVCFRLRQMGWVQSMWTPSTGSCWIG